MCKIFIFCIVFILGVSVPVFTNGSTIIFPRPIRADSSHPTNGGAQCYTKDGSQGKCLSISKCPELEKLVRSRGGIEAPGVSRILQERVCSYNSTEAYLCCLTDVDDTILPTLDECGLPTSGKIVKGQKFDHGTHPWLVGLGYEKYRTSNAIEVVCGGTLITKRHVLTAAHCFHRDRRDRTPMLTHVVLGDHSLSKDIENSPPVILKIASRKNPGFDIAFSYNDIELLVLEKDVQFNNYIKPACLPFDEHMKNFDFENSTMVIAGWGRTSLYELRGTDLPRQAFVSPVPLAQCQEAYKTFHNAKIDKTQMCLGGQGSDTCKGDSGGPALYADTSIFHRYFLIGVTAFGALCGDPRYPGVYAYVPEYMDWIVKNL